MIQDIWKTIQSDPFYKNKTTLYITVDHGRRDGPMWKHHGAKVEHSDEIWFAVMGPNTKPVGEVKTPEQLYQYQHAKTIAAFLGLDFTSPNPIGPIITSVMNTK